MKQRHPYGKPLHSDPQFSKVRRDSCFAKQLTVGLREKSWRTLKDWGLQVIQSREDNSPASGEMLRQQLAFSSPQEYRAVKELIVRKDWPAILDELARWLNNNSHLV